MKKFIFLRNLFVFIFLVMSCGIVSSNSVDNQILSKELQMKMQNNPKKNTDRLNVLIECVDSIIKGEKNFDIAYPYICEIDKLGEYLDDDYGKAYGQYFLGMYYYSQGKRANCINCDLIAQKLVENLSSSKAHQLLRLRICMSLSACYGDCYMFPEKLEQIQKGLKICKAMNNPRYESVLYGHLAGLKAMMEEYRESIQIQQQLLKDTTLPKRTKFIYNFNIGKCFYCLENYDSSIYYYNCAAENIQTQQEKAYISEHIGDIYLYLNKLDTAENYYLKALSDISQNFYSETTYSLAEVYLRKKQYQKALDYIDISLSSDQNNVLMSNHVSAMLTKAKILKEMGHYEEGYAMLMEYAMMKDSLNNVSNVEKVQEMMIQQEVKKMQEQMQFQQQSTKTKQRYVFYGILAGFIFFIIIVILLLNRKNIILKNKTIVERANNVEKSFKLKEFKINILSQNQQTQILNNVIDQLLIFHKTTPDASTKINSFIIDLKKSFRDDALKDFKYYFEQIYPDFYKNIETDYPDITHYELDLCAALKINMTYEEIAEANNISYERIIVLSEKLKKTFHLTEPDASIVDFLQKF